MSFFGTKECDYPGRGNGLLVTGSPSSPTPKHCLGKCIRAGSSSFMYSGEIALVDGGGRDSRFLIFCCLGLG